MRSSRGEIYSPRPALPVEILVATRPFGRHEFHVKLNSPIPWIVRY
jgi:hypothetical protein